MVNRDAGWRGIVLLLMAMLALVGLAPRINRWLARDACRAQRGQWDAAAEQCVRR